MSSLIISDLRIWVSLGCGAEERANPQLVILDIIFNFKSLPKGAVTDELEDTICYHYATKRLEEFCKRHEFKLIEHLAFSASRNLASYCKEVKADIDSITIKACKASPPVAGIHGGVYFTCTEKIS